LHSILLLIPSLDFIPWDIKQEFRVKNCLKWFSFKYQLWGLFDRKKTKILKKIGVHSKKDQRKVYFANKFPLFPSYALEQK
jgi:hypothetical protein